MGLVDYSSSSSDGEEEDENHNQPPAQKKRKTSSSTSTSLPPLPASFHDLYASTVRTTTNDDPSLHQGRKRLIPHVPGNWPSHIYIEWHPTAEEHALLACLLKDLCRSLLQSSSREEDVEEEDDESQRKKLTSFLTSDLGSPLPLHISLSRPIVLRTEEKDAFLERVTDELGGGNSNNSSKKGGKAFELGVHDLSWHRSPDSDRSFLVLRVRSTPTSSTRKRNSTAAENSEKVSSSSANGEKRTTRRSGRRKRSPSPPLPQPVSVQPNGPINPELTALLRRCNDVVAQYGQPRLYSRRRQRPTVDSAAAVVDTSYNDSADSMVTDGTLNAGLGNTSTTTHAVVQRDQVQEDKNDEVNKTAFHVSIAWSFAEPSAEIQERTAAVFGKERFQRGILGDGDGTEGIKIPVDSVKVKIGNVVTSVALAEGLGSIALSGQRGGGGGLGLFGI